MMVATTARPVSRLRARVNFAVFSIFTVGCGWLFVALDRATGQTVGTGSVSSTAGGTGGQGLWLLAPAVVAFALHLLSRDGAGPLGFTLRLPHRARWFGLAALLAPVAIAVAVAAAVAAGAATFAPSASLPAAFAGALGFLLVKNVIEEFIFRGYGTRTAMALGLTGVGPHVLVGLVWGLWHLPLYLAWMPEEDFARSTSLPWALYLPVFLAGIVALAVFYGEMRVRTGSIWPGVVMHTVNNAIATPLLIDGQLRYTGHGDVLFGIAPNSLFMVVLFGGLGLLLLRRRTVRSSSRPPG